MTVAISRCQEEHPPGFPELVDCTVCPRECHVDRTSGVMGFCNTGAEYHVASICIHAGEEPVLSGTRGMCNVFFSRCNMQCIYCQNNQISSNSGNVLGSQLSLSEIVTQIEKILEDKITLVGFVSPSHVIPQMRAIIEAIRRDGFNPTFVMNTNAYDKVETIASLADMIDVYLPDMKYMDASLAERFSRTPNYPRVARRAVAEMHRQKGTHLLIDEDGLARHGLIIRHLVLPGEIDNSIACLRFVAREISPDVHVSVMSQYHPTAAVTGQPRLGRTLRQDEYERVLDEMDRLGLNTGWIQEMGSEEAYLPDFSRDSPFAP
jgi:putative pyruvate formate lyase activating enzyme